MIISDYCNSIQNSLKFVMLTYFLKENISVVFDIVYMLTYLKGYIKHESHSQILQFQLIQPENKDLCIQNLKAQLCAVFLGNLRFEGKMGYQQFQYTKIIYKYRIINGIHRWSFTLYMFLIFYNSVIHIDFNIPSKDNQKKVKENQFKFKHFDWVSV